MSIDAQQVFAALERVPEPCSIAMGAAESIVSMGLVESVDVDGDTVDVSLVLTDPSCVHFTAMRRYIVDEVTASTAASTVRVRMSTTQLWTPERMHPSAPPAGTALLHVVS